MSPGGRAAELSFLRARIARIAADGTLAPRFGGVFPRGQAFGVATILDKILPQGLAAGALHEIVAARPHDAAAATGFTLALAARFLGEAPARSALIWIVEAMAGRETGEPYGPGLRLYGLDPARLVLVHPQTPQETFWAIEEALKCRAAGVVVGEIWRAAKAYDLTASRRLLLAAQKQRRPGLLLAAGLAGHAGELSSGATTRFEVRGALSPHLPSAGARLPLPGLTAFAVRIAKARAGPAFAIPDKDMFWPVLWDPAKASFRDAISLPQPAFSRHRPPVAQDALLAEEALLIRPRIWSAGDDRQGEEHAKARRGRS